MRKAFISALGRIAARDERVVLLTGDLGFTVVEEFAESWPNRFYNVGVAEQNMIGVATGLAEGGFIPFVYSISTFVSMRAYEFLRNGPILHRLPVRIIAIGQGFDYGVGGATHHALEDVALMRVQPNLHVIVPSDDDQAVAALQSTWDSPSPIYYRLAKDPTPAIAQRPARFDPYAVDVLAEGNNILLLATGTIAREAFHAASLLRHDGIAATVAVVASINPLPVEELTRLISRFSVVLTIEEHYVTGGFGSSICELVARAGLASRVVTTGIGDRVGECGSRPYLRRLHGLTADAIAAQARCVAPPA